MPGQVNQGEGGTILGYASSVTWHIGQGAQIPCPVNVYIHHGTTPDTIYTALVKGAISPTIWERS